MTSNAEQDQSTKVTHKNTTQACNQTNNKKKKYTKCMKIKIVFGKEIKDRKRTFKFKKKHQVKS